METECEADALIDALFNSAPVEWKYLMMASPETLREAVTGLDAIIEKAARLRGYVEAHEAGKAHEAAVARSNRLVTAVRRALGYAYPKAGEVTF
jgi:hypothetical protein